MVTDGSSVDGAPLQQFERQLLENYPFLAVLMTVLLAAPYAKIYESDLRNWDWLLISGILVFLVAYPCHSSFRIELAKHCGSFRGGESCGRRKR
jgi:hypothetical protein